MPRSRLPISTSSASPAWWPSESLTSLKRSRSIIATATWPPSRSAIAIACSIRSRNSVRLGRPVRPSWSAWCSLISAWRSSASWAALRSVSSWTITIPNEGRPSGSRTIENEAPTHTTEPSLRFSRVSIRSELESPANSSATATDTRSCSSGSRYSAMWVRTSSALLQPEHLEHRRVGVDDLAVVAQGHHAGDRAVVDRLESRQGVDLPALGLELGGAADAFGQDAGEELERLAILLAEPLVLGGAHHAERADGSLAGEQRHADVRAIAHLRADLRVEAGVVLGVLDQQRCASRDREAGNGLAHRPPGIQEARRDPARGPRDDVIALDQADHRALGPRQRLCALDDHLHHVVEVARRGGGDVALGGDDALEPVGLVLELPVGDLGLGDVLDHRDRDLRGLGRAGVAPHRDPDPDHLTVLADVALLVLIGGALAVEQLLEEALGDIHVLGVGERGEAHSHQLPGVVAEHPLDRGVGFDRPAVGPDADDADRGALEQHPEALVRRASWSSAWSSISVRRNRFT